MRGLGLAGLVGLSVLTLSDAGAARGALIEVEAGPHERRGTPVVVPLPEGASTGGPVVLVPAGEGDAGRARPVPAQIVAGAHPAVAFVLDAMPAGARRRYRIVPDRGPAGDATVTCNDDGSGLVLAVGGRPALRYNHAEIEPPAGLDPLYRRSGFVHPLRTPSGRVVTDDFPPDHAHQHGLFFAWVETTFAGHKVDFWNQPKRTGRVRHVAVLGTTSGPVFGAFAARLRHEDIAGPGSPVPVLDEVWTVRAYALADRFLIDFESRQECAGDRPLEINEYHYGGLGLRGNRAWYDPEVKGEGRLDPARSGRSDFLTSEGRGRADGNHTRPRWVDLSGLVEGQHAGVTILDHPDNFRSPQPVRLHPTKPYFCFAPMVLGAFTIEPGRPYISRYRLVLHDGSPDPEGLDRLWRDYAEPPRVRVLEED